MKIFFVNGSRGGDEVEFALPEITIGRDDGNILRIPAEGVSRYHAKFRHTPEGWLLSDEGSTNGVKLNRTKISGDHPLAEGDIVDIGGQLLRVSELSSKTPEVIFNPIPMKTPVLTGSLENPQVAPGTAVEPTVILRPEVPRETEPAPASPVEEFKLEAASLFDRGRKKKSAAEASAASGTAAGGKPRRCFSGMLFYGFAGCLAVIVISMVMKIFTAPAAGSTAAEAPPPPSPLTVLYSKEIKAPDNVFRFAMDLEGGKVTFTIDDIKSKRHYQRTFDAPETAVETLRRRIHSSGLRTLPPPESSRTVESINRKLTVVEPPTLLKFTMAGKYLPTEFEQVENAISDFAETYGLQTIVLAPEELRAQANKSFNNAEDLYANREAKPTNLRDAIIRYRQVINYLEQFSPHPELWSRAKQRLAEAEELRNRKLENLEFERVRLSGIRDLQQMRRVFMQVMELTETDSTEYQRAHLRLYKLDQHLGNAR